jgi:hypothetical protein
MIKNQAIKSHKSLNVNNDFEVLTQTNQLDEKK